MIRSILKAALLVMLLLFAGSAAAQIPDLDVLVPEAAECADESYAVPMYAGPTVQFRQMDATLNPSVSGANAGDTPKTPFRGGRDGRGGGPPRASAPTGAGGNGLPHQCCGTGSQ